MEIEEESVEKFTMANCVDIMKRNESLGQRKLFKCRTCKREVGGHRAGKHKNRANGLKKFKCFICGEEFAVAHTPDAIIIN